MRVAPVDVMDFRLDAGVRRPGDWATATLAVRGAASAPAPVWIGYSVQDPAGRWYDVPARPAVLTPGAVLAATSAWRVPAEPEAGAYRAVMAVWSAPPGTAGARRLASADRAGAFRVRVGAPLLMDELPGAWRAADHALGRGRVRAEHIRLAPEGGFRLELPAGACDGAELRAAEPIQYGEFAVRLRTPSAPGSLSAVFLYGQDGDESDEIDIELFNDGSRRALLTSWVRGVQRRQAEVVLPFDPAAQAHAYAIRWTPRALVFVADGAALARWADGYPHGPMRAMVNAWWPTWLPCAPAADARALWVGEPRLAPAAAPSAGAADR